MVTTYTRNTKPLEKEIIHDKKPFVSYPFNDKCCHHIATIPLICFANQLTGFYMIGTLVDKGLISI